MKSVAKDEDIYTEHAKNVYRYLFSLSGEADTAEELTQETFYRALKSLDSYRGEASPLRLAGDFSFRDIGEILCRSEVWARLRFYRGKQELSEIIGGENNE